MKRNRHRVLDVILAFFAFVLVTGFSEEWNWENIPSVSRIPGAQWLLKSDKSNQHDELDLSPETSMMASGSCRESFWFFPESVSRIKMLSPSLPVIQEQLQTIRKQFIRYEETHITTTHIAAACEITKGETLTSLKNSIRIVVDVSELKDTHLMNQPPHLRLETALVISETGPT